MNNTNKGLLLVFSTALISGFSVFINKFGVALSDPSVFALLKNSAVAIILTGLIMVLGRLRAWRNIPARQWPWLVLIGLIGGGLPFLLFFKGLTLTSAAQGSFIHKSMFLFVVLLAIIFLKEKISKNFLIGGLLLLAGNLMMLKTLDFSFGLGDGLILLAVIFWAVESVISKYVLQDVCWRIVAWAKMFFGALFILFYLILSGHAAQISAVTWPQIGWIALTSFLLLGYTLTWYNGLRYVPVSLATTILLLGSPITITLTAISAGKITIQDGISGLLILAGLIIIFGLNISKSTDAKSLITSR